jgi:hypothetical protein
VVGPIADQHEVAAGGEGEAGGGGAHLRLVQQLQLAVAEVPGGGEALGPVHTRDVVPLMVPAGLRGEVHDGRHLDRVLGHALPVEADEEGEEAEEGAIVGETEACFDCSI